MCVFLKTRDAFVVFFQLHSSASACGLLFSCICAIRARSCSLGVHQRMLHLDLISLVAVFVCVVPSAQPIPLQSQVEHNRIPTIPLCSGLPALRAGRVYRSHRPLIMFLVYQIEAQPAVLSHSPSDTHTRTGAQSNTFLPGLRVRLGCYALACGPPKRGGVNRDLCVCVFVIMAACLIKAGRCGWDTQTTQQ